MAIPPNKLRNLSQQQGREIRLHHVGNEHDKEMTCTTGLIFRFLGKTGKNNNDRSPGALSDGHVYEPQEQRQEHQKTQKRYIQENKKKVHTEYKKTHKKKEKKCWPARRAHTLKRLSSDASASPCSSGEVDSSSARGSTSTRTGSADPGDTSKIRQDILRLPPAIRERDKMKKKNEQDEGTKTVVIFRGKNWGKRGGGECHEAAGSRHSGHWHTYAVKGARKQRKSRQTRNTAPPKPQKGGPKDLLLTARVKKTLPRYTHQPD